MSVLICAISPLLIEKQKSLGVGMIQIDKEQIRKEAEHLMGTRFSLFTPLNGRNSRIWKACLPDDKLAVVKQYGPRTDGAYSRLEAEWRACTFLHDHGVANVPMPLTRSYSGFGLAVYSFIEGSPPVPPVSDDNVHTTMKPLCDFLRVLHGLRTQAQGYELPLAADACCPPANLLVQIENRIVALESAEHLPQQEEQHIQDELLFFLHSFCRPAFARRKKNALENGFLDDPGIEVRTLSPSDFGFHNALLQRDGTLAFLDFEYFGWDDPAKLFADTLIHPHERMCLTAGQRQYLLDNADDIYGYGLQRRVCGLLPLMGVKWALIMLNEFLPLGRARREFAGVRVDASLLKDKLNMAREMIEKTE